jgi:hypothetical protein
MFQKLCLISYLISEAILYESMFFNKAYLNVGLADNNTML